MEPTGPYYRHDVSSASTFNPNASESDIPLRPYDPERDPGSEESVHQQWDDRGQAVGYAPDPRLHAPRPRPPFNPSALYASPDAAAAVTSSRDSEDEWTNAHTPKTSRLPDIATISVRAAAPNPPPESFPPTEYAHTGAPPTSSIPLAQQSPHSGHTQSPPLSTTSQYVTYQPEHFAVSTTSSKVGPGLDAAQSHYNPYTSPMTGFESVATRTFSPPLTYR
jgi:hypothetical protein